jgi:hypothetical protein
MATLFTQHCSEVLSLAETKYYEKFVRGEIVLNYPLGPEDVCVLFYYKNNIWRLNDTLDSKITGVIPEEMKLYVSISAFMCSKNSIIDFNVEHFVRMLGENYRNGIGYSVNEVNFFYVDDENITMTNDSDPGTTKDIDLISLFYHIIVCKNFYGFEDAFYTIEK